mgnify:CR=1 FL=1
METNFEIIDKESIQTLKFLEIMFGNIVFFRTANIDYAPSEKK